MIISRYDVTSAPPTSYTPGATSIAADQVADHVGRGDWLNRGADPAWTDHEREPLGEIPQHLKRDAAGAEHDRCSKLDNGDFSRCERGADLLATREMLGLRVVAQATEVDDASKTRGCGSSPEAFRQLAVTSTKAFGTQRVHEIESDLATDQRAA